MQCILVDMVIQLVVLLLLLVEVVLVMGNKSWRVVIGMEDWQFGMYPEVVVVAATIMLEVMQMARNHPKRERTTIATPHPLLPKEQFKKYNQSNQYEHTPPTSPAWHGDTTHHPPHNHPLSSREVGTTDLKYTMSHVWIVYLH